MPYLVGIAILLVFETVADIFAKEYSLHTTWWLWMGSFGAYMLANVFWLVAMKNGAGLARGTTLFVLGTLVLGVVIGAVFYREHVTVTQWIGIALGIVSSLFLL